MGIVGNSILGITLAIIAFLAGFGAKTYLTEAFKLWKEDRFINSAEFKKLVPDIDVKINPIAETIPLPNGTSAFATTKYTYPFKEYVLSIYNTNNDSVIPQDTHITFFFPKTITEIHNHPSVHGPGSSHVMMYRMFREKSPGVFETIQQRPQDTPLTDNFSFSAQQFDTNSGSYNSNLAEFHCERWPKNGVFAARVIVDMTDEVKTVLGSDQRDKYSGSYSYDIKAKSYQGKVEGVIPSNVTEFDKAVKQEREKAISFVSKDISVISRYVEDQTSNIGRGALVIKLIDFERLVHSNSMFPYLGIEETANFFKKKESVKSQARSFLETYDVNSEFIMLIIDRKNELWLYAKALKEEEKAKGKGTKD